MNNLKINEKVYMYSNNSCNTNDKQKYIVVKKFKDNSYLLEAESRYAIPQKRKIKNDYT